MASVLSSRALQKPRACSQCLDAFTACQEHSDVAAAAGGRAWSGGKQCTGRIQPACPVHAGRAAGRDAPVQVACWQRAERMIKMANAAHCWLGDLCGNLAHHTRYTGVASLQALGSHRAAPTGLPYIRLFALSGSCCMPEDGSWSMHGALTDGTGCICWPFFV